MPCDEYTWQRYYEDLYHRAKKTNNALAVELGETEMKAAELEIALNRVIGSPFWRALAPARKIYHKVTGKGEQLTEGSSGYFGEAKGKDAAKDSESAAEMSESERIYASRLAEYEDYYAQWIRKDPYECKYAGKKNDITGTDFHVFDIEECTGAVSPVDNCENAEWLVFCGHNSVFTDGAEERLKEALTGRRDVQIVYSDEDYACYKSDNTGLYRINPWFKPDWSPDTLVSFWYLGHFTMIKRELASQTAWKGSENGYLNVYDLFLQASGRVGTHFDAPEVLHIPQILVHNILEKKEYEAAKHIDALSAHNYSPNDIDKVSAEYGADKDIVMEACGLKVIGADSAFDEIKPCPVIEGQDTDIRQAAYPVPDGTLISVLILTKDHPEVLKTCLKSFAERTDYDCIEFIIVDNGSSEENKALYEVMIREAVGEYSYKYLYRPMDFNFSALCNIAAGEAAGDLLLFMNDDMEIIQKDWLKLMAGLALLPHAGAVGAKLMYAGSDLIQHVGISNLEIGPSHKLVMYPDNRCYYWGRNILCYDMLGVTGACLMIAKTKFNHIGGFNEDFAVAYNDVDLCMKASEAGYNNILCGGALLYHYESMTRGLDADDDNKWNRLLNEKKKLYSLHPNFFRADPYYNRNLIGNNSNYLSNYDFGYNNHLKTQIIRQIGAGCEKQNARELAEKSPQNYRISIDYAGRQLMHNLGEPEIIEVRGWCFKSGIDNFDQKVRLILKAEQTSDGRNGSLSKDANSAPVYEVETDVMPREDLEKTFENECHIKLCGFVAKILKKDIQEGTYRIGLENIHLNDDLADESKTCEVIFTESYLTI